LELEATWVGVHEALKEASVVQTQEFIIRLRLWRKYFIIATLSSALFLLLRLEGSNVKEFFSIDQIELVYGTTNAIFILPYISVFEEASAFQRPD